jgi:pyruvate/2-oxoglutarate dehydrogenase complex dihydrolipoamide dehydrogenase (E3) component
VRARPRDGNTSSGERVPTGVTTDERADVVVIGMGPGGEDVAGRLAEAGLDVIGIERELVGGECPYWGCIPSKMMIRAAHLLAEARRIPGMAGDATVVADWEPVARRIRDEATDSWDDTAAVERFEGKGGRFVRGTGRIAGPGKVQVQDGPLIEVSRGIVLATGTRPAIPPVDGLDSVPYWTNRDAIEAKELPTSLVVLGGGAIGGELAQAFARFGVAVTVLEGADRLVPAEEPEVGLQLAEVFRHEGIEVRVGAQVGSVLRDGARVAVELASGEVLHGAQLLVATGRRADLPALGLDTVGIESSRWVPVDAHLRVADGVWAVGDLTGQGAFTHVAMYQSPIAVADILGVDHAPADYRALPRATFTDPEIGSVGLSEAAAREQGLEVAVGTTQTAHTARGWLHKAGNEGLIKVVADAERGVLVGATAMGPAGGEVLGLLTLAVHAEVPIEQLRSMIYAYPTFHRGVEDALRDLASQ